MSIAKAVERAYKTMFERNWDTIYWSIDLHGVVLKSTYEPLQYEFVNDMAKTVLQMISKFPETKIIVWSSMHDYEKAYIVELFGENDIKLDFFNENPAVKDTVTGCFMEKFYFSVLLDDKAGFDPDTDWVCIYEKINEIRTRMIYKNSIVDNLKELKKAVENHAGDLFDLSKFRHDTDCGTLFCTAGVMASTPFFRRLGFDWVPNEDVGSSTVCFGSEPVWEANLDQILGQYAYERLFDVRNEGIFDCDHPDVEETHFGYGDAGFSINAISLNVSDKELALWRIQKQIELYEKN